MSPAEMTLLSEASYNSEVGKGKAPKENVFHIIADASSVVLHSITLESRPTVPPAQKLFNDIREAMVTERRCGFEINNNQPQESFLRMNATVTNLLKSYATTQSDWTKYAKFNDLHYVRHLIDDCEEMELMIICWKAHQGSRVHNHASSHCWLTVLDGEVEEELYQEPTEEGAAAPTQLAINRRGVGQTAYINDHLALHAVRGTEANAVTLHLYAPPIRKVKLYEGDQVVTRVPGFNTVRGEVRKAD